MEGIDWPLFLLLLTLSLMSLVNLYSAGPAFLQKQAVFFGLGYAILGGLLFIDSGCDLLLYAIGGWYLLDNTLHPRTDIRDALVDCFLS